MYKLYTPDIARISIGVIRKLFLLILYSLKSTNFTFHVSPIDALSYTVCSEIGLLLNGNWVLTHIII
jgi:hypothetical protein